MSSDEEVILRERAADLRDQYDEIYAEPDPRAYFRVLHGLDYCLPELARLLFRDCIRTVAATRAEPAKVLDLGCGFGVNAALVRYPIDLNRLAHRYRDVDWVEIDADRLKALDRSYFASWPEQVSVEINGYETSETAAAYARAVGLVSHAITADLEVDPLRQDDRDALAGTNCIISTGCVSYASAATFDRLFDAIGDPPPWVAIFVLRTENIANLQECFEARGMKVEKLKGVTFIQRRYHSTAEWTQALLNLENRGLPSTGKEAQGLMHAELFVVRPEAEAGRDLREFLTISSGAEAIFGGWRGRPWGP
jgi:SAM-dependent methyltransferase